MLGFEEFVTYAFMLSLLLISAPLAVVTLLWLSKNFIALEDGAKK